MQVRIPTSNQYVTPPPAPSPIVAPPSKHASPTRRLVIGLGAIVVIAALLLAGRRFGALIPQFTAYIASLGALGPAVFVLGYIVASVAFVPGSLLTLAAGAIFGLVKGVGLVFAGAVLGSTAAFLISRYAARGTIEKRLSGNARFAAIDRAIGEDGRRIVFLLRLSPAFPFSVLNYALGLTRVTLADYLLASFGMLPGTLLYVYYGRLIGDAAALASGNQAPKGPAYYTLLVVGLLATVAVTTLVTRTARKALREATGEGTT